MNIKIGPRGKLFLEGPQQRWFGENPEIMEIASFAGQEMMAIQKSDYEPEIFELHYLGMVATGFQSISEAKERAPTFAREVLAHLRQMIAD